MITNKKNNIGFKQNFNKHENNTLEHKVKIIMPEIFLEKVQYLCKSISQVEWSGILMYTVEGSIKDYKNMIITLKDIIPMNKGTKSYTSFNFNEKKRDNSGHEDRHIDYCNENPEAMDWKQGLIHSHNTFGVFFSGTDWDELEENSANHNFYLSLICNNNMDFTAKIGFKATAQVESKANYKALDEFGNSYEYLKGVKHIQKFEKFFVIDTDIIVPEIQNNFDAFFLKSVKEIIEKADAVITYPTNTYKPTSNLPASPYGAHKQRPYTAPSSPNIISEKQKLETFLIRCITLSDINIHGVNTISGAIYREKGRGTFFKKQEYLAKFLEFFATKYKSIYGEISLEELLEIVEKAGDVLEKTHKIANPTIQPFIEDLTACIDSFATKLLDTNEEELFDKTDNFLEENQNLENIYDLLQ